MNRSRKCTRLLTGSAVCLVVVLVLAVMVHVGWSSLQAVDTKFGTPAEMWTTQHASAVTVLLAIEVMFGTVCMTIYTLVLVLVLWLKGYHRAAVWTVAVMVGTASTTTVMKLALHRQRPRWDITVHSLTSFSFPSGHASAIASGMGVVAVLTLLHVERPVVRRAVLTVGVALVVVVGVDRILLGVHNLSDVIAGYAVAGFWVFAMVAAKPPVDDRPRGRPSAPGTE